MSLRGARYHAGLQPPAGNRRHHGDPVRPGRQGGAERKDRGDAARSRREPDGVAAGAAPRPAAAEGLRLRLLRRRGRDSRERPRRALLRAGLRGEDPRRIRAGRHRETDPQHPGRRHRGVPAGAGIRGGGPPRGSRGARGGAGPHPEVSGERRPRGFYDLRGRVGPGGDHGGRRQQDLHDGRDDAQRQDGPELAPEGDGGEGGCRRRCEEARVCRQYGHR
mmetsp:Transcript_4108/g.8566  ORF Transcript_4108/g.8566 Transcript_4108/m.8566 type:complete len:220 (+) Transcript_4108:261-920(+)